MPKTDVLTDQERGLVDQIREQLAESEKALEWFRVRHPHIGQLLNQRIPGVLNAIARHIQAGQQLMELVDKYLPEDKK